MIPVPSEIIQICRQIGNGIFRSFIGYFRQTFNEWITKSWIQNYLLISTLYFFLFIETYRRLDSALLPFERKACLLDCFLLQEHLQQTIRETK